MSATWPGLDSVGTRVWETPKVPWDRTRDRMKGARGRGVREAVVFVAEGEGSGNDWKALSARRPSPRC